jgi:hypothetical protein
MGPEYWKLDKNSKLLKCAERSLPACEGETEDCCKVVACEYCLTFTSSGYATEYGVASGSTEWIGAVAGASFIAYWQKAYNGVCQFIVTINGTPISIADCGHTSCRDSSGTASLVIGGHSGTLKWDKRLHHPLKYVIDPLTSCRVHFCGDCECTCETLCVVVTEPPPYPGETVNTTVLDPYSCDGLLPADCGFCDAAPPDSMTYGELPNIEDDFCLKPTWSNTVAGRSITLTLTRGASGQCLLGGSVYGEAVGPINVTDCKTITASFTLADGTKIDVSCKECGCDTGPPADALDCCDKVPCAFCVTYTPYGGDAETVHSEYTDGKWSGSVGGSGFLMYWHKNIYGECEFVVEYNGEKVLEQTIAEGASCDSTSGSVIIGDDVLSWSIVSQTALKRQDADTPFCGACDCVSECFCVTITESPLHYVGGEINKGELCNSAYECEPPRWNGSIGDHLVDMTLEADKVTGGCILVIDIDGEIFVEAITLCDDIVISLKMYDGTTVNIVSKKCSCDVIETPCTCCECIESLLVTAHLSVCCGSVDISEKIPAIVHIGAGECLSYGRGINIIGVSCDGPLGPLGGYAFLYWDLLCLDGIRYIELAVSLLASASPGPEYQATARVRIQLDNCRSDLTISHEPATYCVEEGYDFPCVCESVAFSVNPIFIPDCV